MTAVHDSCALQLSPHFTFWTWGDGMLASLQKVVQFYNSKEDTELCAQHAEVDN